MRVVFAMIMGVVLFTSCVHKKKEKVQPLDTSSLMNQVSVDSVIQTSDYTYLKVTEKGNTFWMAANKMNASVGDKYYYTNPLEMKNFKSKSLDRVFPSIYFVQDISSNPIKPKETNNMNTMTGKKSPKGKVLVKEDPNIKVEVPEGGISIGNLYASMEKYAGKTAKVRGQVVKVNNNIMGKNWIHLQDGTKNGDSYDLTVTSTQTAQVGDVITVEGTIALNKDFGAGYFYDLIMENAKISK
ncbi:MAG TPA: hypothetical protein VKA27_10410 [Sunxiuqinia sp.]|nr:hypothetical protein [Sunxiuqinia sp.]